MNEWLVCYMCYMIYSLLTTQSLSDWLSDWLGIITGSVRHCQWLVRSHLITADLYYISVSFVCWTRDVLKVVVKVVVSLWCHCVCCIVYSSKWWGGFTMVLMMLNWWRLSISCRSMCLCLSDIRDLISVDDVMEDDVLQMGPNGGLIFCMEFVLLYFFVSSSYLFSLLSLYWR